jgi:hypothetical protein
MFEDWLSPDVMEILIKSYAKPSSKLGILRWHYVVLGARVWGQFSGHEKTLYVNRVKTHNLFKQQVHTILHEIQHWNQLVDECERGGNATTMDRKYRAESASKGYFKNDYEVDARNFSDVHLEAAIDKLGRHYGGKIEGGSFDTALEELVDEFADDGIVTRAQIGTALKAHAVNSPDNMKKAMSLLNDLGMKVR